MKKLILKGLKNGWVYKISKSFNAVRSGDADRFEENSRTRVYLSACEAPDSVKLENEFDDY